MSHNIVKDTLPWNKAKVLYNYVVPGLNSFLFEGFTVRAFSSTRNQQLGEIAPHSHRYDFMCCVLEGAVSNTIWERDDKHTDKGDSFFLTTLRYGGKPGHYTKKVDMKKRYSYIPDTKIYIPGQWYAMKSNQIHSIRFMDRAKVLFLEGPTRQSFSFMLEPAIHGDRIPIGKTESWMFK